MLLSLISSFSPIQEDGAQQLGLFSVIQQKEAKQVELKDKSYLENLKNGDKIGFLLDFQDREFCYISFSDWVVKVSTLEAKNIIENPEIKKVTYDVKNMEFDIKGVVSDVQLSSYIKDSSRKHDLITQINECLEVIPNENDYYLLIL